MTKTSKKDDPKNTEKKPAAAAKDKASAKADDKDKGKNKDVMKRREKRTIPVKLTDAEIVKFSKEHIETLDKIVAKEEEKKTADTAIKGDIALLEEADAKLVSLLRSGTQERELEVDIEYDWRTNEVRTIRVDTKEVINTRAMDYSERQREMFGVDHKKDRGEVKDAKKAGDKPGEKGERKQPKPNDVIDVETLEGWKRGKVLPSSGSVLDVECSDGTIAHAPVEGQTWRWPDEVGENSAPVKNLPKRDDKIEFNDVVEGWIGGEVTAIDEDTMVVKYGDDETISIAIASDEWRWPEKLTATVGEHVEAKAEADKGGGKKRRKRAKGDGDVAPMPGEEGLDF